MQASTINTLKKSSMAVLALSIALTALQGCKREQGLFPESTTSISDKNIFDTPQRIEGLVNGIYKAFKGASLYGGRYFMYQDFRGEEFITITANSYTVFESWNNSYSSGSNDINSLWSTAYTAINNANILIEGLANRKDVVGEEKANAYIAEAKFLRAVSYFSLVTVFGQPYTKDQGASPGLPLRLQAELDTRNNDLKRSSVSEIYAQIIQDLDDAEKDLPESYSNAGLNTTRAHKNTARAFKTRVFLAQNNWAAVLKEAVKIVPQTKAPFAAVTGVKSELQPDILTLFGANFTTTESLLSMPFSTVDSYSGQTAIAYVYFGNKEYYLNPNGILGDPQWKADDRRRLLLAPSGGKQFLKKFAKVSPYIDYIPVIRYAEVLLNYAEAAAQSGQLPLAAELVKAVHKRSDASFAISDSQSADKQALLAIIAKERRIELLGEGFRGFDLLRKLEPLPAKADETIQTPAVPVSAQNYIFPPPNTELATNKLF
ncbi:RagB/SusD family nutrient uptake outer membrane protein [Sphingobacterium sp. Mn56C]|uniref:RagB/SusD family nutrient uptake outer membrane protein n=1 Tax=Sphingobacterium sp. Mn56C TaxID=3395261 RepID=UPI003BDEFD61